MAKVAVNIALGTIEIEGEEDFVLKAFSQVRDALKDVHFDAQSAKPPEDDPGSMGLQSTSSKGEPAGKQKGQNGKSSGSKKAQPSLNPHLDLAGIEGFVSKYNPTKNTERILVFAAFLRDEADVYPASDDDIYTCFHTMKSVMKIPIAFGKNMNDAKAAGFIDYEKLTEVTITTMGENQLTAMLKKAGSE